MDASSYVCSVTSDQGAPSGAAVDEDEAVEVELDHLRPEEAAVDENADHCSASAPDAPAEPSKEAGGRVDVGSSRVVQTVGETCTVVVEGNTVVVDNVDVKRRFLFTDIFARHR